MHVNREQTDNLGPAARIAHGSHLRELSIGRCVSGMLRYREINLERRCLVSRSRAVVIRAGVCPDTT